MKKLVALLLAFAMMISVVACGSNDDSNADSASEPVTITVLGYSYFDSTLNILRDQLTKAGFNVVLETQPDYSSFKTAQDAGDWDIAISGWTTVTGNPDYAIRDVYASYGQYNGGGINDAKVDELIDKASTETPAEYVATYTELENYLVTEMCYTLPLYYQSGLLAVNNTIVDVDSVRLPQSRSAYWEDYEYVDPANNETRPLIMYSGSSELTSLDPIQANDGSINQLSPNINAHIINMTEDDQITAEGSMSYNYSIAEGNQAYYFILRDDVHFSKVVDKHAVLTDILCGGEDVVYSLTRAADQNSVASHKTYNLHKHMEEISIVTDMEELNSTIDADTGATVFETLTAGLDNVTTLVEADADVDNAAGKYQVVKVATANAFPQVLYFLAHQSAGIINKEQAEEYNSKFTVAEYDPNTDVCYGNAAAIKNGENMLYLSGPYVLVDYTDYGVKFEKNPGYMPGTENEAHISNIEFKFYKDATSGATGFRSGETDIISGLGTNDVATVEAEDQFTVYKYLRHATTYCEFNMREGKIMSDVNLRKAVFYAINQQDFITYNNGLYGQLYSSFSTLINTGNVHKQDLEKSAEYLKAYNESLAQ